MEVSKRLELAQSELDRLQEFFPRVDAKATALFGINAAMLAVLCLNMNVGNFWNWLLFPASLTFTAITISLGYIFHCYFPHLAGGTDSLIYFGEIAKRSEPDFLKRIQSVSQEELLEDFYKQIWRNSCILATKFNAVKKSTILTLVGMVPWCAFLIGCSIQFGHAVVLH